MKPGDYAKNPVVSVVAIYANHRLVFWLARTIGRPMAYPTGTRVLDSGNPAGKETVESGELRGGGENGYVRRNDGMIHRRKNFYGLVATGAILIVFAGFARTYFL